MIKSLYLSSDEAKAVTSPPTFNAPLKPIPPVTINAPVVLEVDDVELDILTAAENVLAPVSVCVVSKCTVLADK